MSTEPDPNTFVALPRLCDEAAAEILNFIQIMHQLVEDRYASQIHRHYDRKSQHNILQSQPISTDDDPPF